MVKTCSITLQYYSHACWSAMFNRCMKASVTSTHRCNRCTHCKSPDAVELMALRMSVCRINERKKGLLWRSLRCNSNFSSYLMSHLSRYKQSFFHSVWTAKLFLSKPHTHSESLISSSTLCPPSSLCYAFHTFTYLHGTKVMVFGCAECSKPPISSSALPSFLPSTLLRWLRSSWWQAASLLLLLPRSHHLGWNKTSETDAALLLFINHFKRGIIQGHNSCILHWSIFSHIRASVHRSNLHIQCFYATLPYMNGLNLTMLWFGCSTGICCYT